ncbi:hypothetical protein F4810DRAFT_654262 [Camillea tinctor]|nr:hypothetical protein F4810DRAFT_654262 [Camillea tinctor]
MLLLLLLLGYCYCLFCVFCRLSLFFFLFFLLRDTRTSVQRTRLVLGVIGFYYGSIETQNESTIFISYLVTSSLEPLLQLHT